MNIRFNVVRTAALAALLGLASMVSLAPASLADGSKLQSGSAGWTIDTAHTGISFSVRHMVVSRVRGRFNSFSGSVVANTSDFTKSSVQFTIQVASIDTNQPQRDAHLKTADFFDAAKYPQIIFKSSSISKVSEGKYVAHGSFTMHGVTKQIDLPFDLYGPLKDAFGQVRLGIQASLIINRQDYGVKWNQKLDSGGLAVSNDVDIEINLEATPAA